MAARRWWFFGAAVLIVCICGRLWAKQGIIHLKDGSPDVVGDVTDDPANTDSVTVVIHGVETTVPRANIDSIDYPASLDSQFTDRISKLDPKDVDGRLQVAQWACDNNRYDLARQAVLQALDIDHNNPQALQLLKSITDQLALASASGPPPVTHVVPPPTNGGVTPQPAPPVAQADKNYLTDDDINQIRQLEMKPSDTSLRVNFLNDVRKRYLAMAGEDPRQFYNQHPIDQAREILNKGDPAMATDVRIITDPSALTTFRQRVQPIILSGCATSGCHNASTAAGGFALYTGDSTAAWYTNFYLLQTYSHKTAAEAEGTGGARLMIDRTYPDSSLMLQYGLPARVAETPHPAVPNLHQIFSGANDARYQLIRSWMSDALKPNGGDYPDIHYDRTAGLPGTQPSAPTIPPPFPPAR